MVGCSIACEAQTYFRWALLSPRKLTVIMQNLSIFFFSRANQHLRFYFELNYYNYKHSTTRSLFLNNNRYPGIIKYSSINHNWYSFYAIELIFFSF